MTSATTATTTTGAAPSTEALERAEKEFTYLREKDEGFAPANAGLGLVAFLRGAYGDAARLFGAALASAEEAARPQCATALLHYAVGLAAFRADRAAEAETHFEAAATAAAAAGVRSVEVDALVAQGVLLLNRGEVEAGLRRVAAAHARDAAHPLALVHLANHFLLRGDAARGLDFASRAAESSAADAHVRAYALYLVGKYYHQQGQHELARTHYGYAVEAWPGLALAQYGLAQMHVERGDYEAARAAYERVLGAVPDSFEAVSALALVHLRLGRAADARRCATRALALCDTEPLPYLTLAQLGDDTQPVEQRYGAYRRAVEILALLQRRVPAQAWNNLGVLQHRLGLLGDAEHSLREALRATGSAPERCTRAAAPILFNLARLYEDRREDARAEAQYLALLARHPRYVDCYLRLGVMAQRRGCFGAAGRWLAELLAVAPAHPDALCVLGSIHFAQHKWSIAQQYYQQVFDAAGCRDDAYALVALGNMYYCLKFEGKARMDRFFQKACDCYAKALRLHPRCLAAATGVALAAAEKGRTAAARAVLAQVRDAAPDVNAPHYAVNLAHLAMLDGAYAQAAVLYEDALAHAAADPDAALPVLLCLANALYRQHRYRAALPVLERALRAAPAALFLWSNLALVSELEAIASLNADKHTKHAFLREHHSTGGSDDAKEEGGGEGEGDDESAKMSVDELHAYATHYRAREKVVARAEQLLSESIRLFGFLAGARPEPARFGMLTYTHSPATALKHKTHSERLIGDVRRELASVRARAAAYSARWEAAAARSAQEREAQRRAEEEARAQAESERLARLHALEREDEARQKEAVERLAQLDAAHPTPRRTAARDGKRRPAYRRELVDEEEEDAGESAPTQELLGSRKRRVEDDDDDDDDKSSGKEDDNNDEDLFGDADVGGDEAPESKEPSRKRGRKLAQIDDDDDDDEDDDGGEEGKML